MKAQTLSQKWQEIKAKIKAGESRDLAITEFEQYAEFVLQDFKHGLITELFEGWTLDNYTPQQGYYINGEDFISLLHTTMGAYLINKYEFIFPDTLDIFISHCQDAGIELKLKVKV